MFFNFSKSCKWRSLEMSEVSEESVFRISHDLFSSILSNAILIIVCVSFSSSPIFEYNKSTDSLMISFVFISTSKFMDKPKSCAKDFINRRLNLSIVEIENLE